MGTTTSAGPLKSWGRIGQSEVVALLLEDWELGRVAMSCHMAVDLLLCQEMRDACLGELTVVGLLLFTGKTEA